MPLFGLGKDLTFYTLLEQQAEAAHRAALAFAELCRDFQNLAARARALKDIEHEADALTHQLANKTDSTFVTPLDKEDLQALSSRLDDITDAIEAASGRIALFQLPAPRPDLAPLVAELVEITRRTHEAVSGLRDMRGRSDLHDTLIAIHALENKSDDLFRQALADLFNAPDADPLQVLKWKEVYDRIEMAVDRCEDVASIVESVVVKYA